MSQAACTAPLGLAKLTEYWLGELDAADEEAVEQHLLGCGHCTASLQGIVELAGGIRALVREGAVLAVVTDAFVQRLAAQGLRLREYRLAPGGSVHCTIAPDDDLIVSRLQVPLAEVERLDLVMADSTGAVQARLSDIPFDRAAGELVILPRAADLRPQAAAVHRFQLRAVDAQGERLIGEYTFIHARWQE